MALKTPRLPLLCGLGAASLAVIALFLVRRLPDAAPPPPALAANASDAARYVGSSACESCHADAVRAWRTSQHAQAMQQARPDTVLGDFSGVTVRTRVATYTFKRHDDRYIVRTIGPDGRPDDFEITHTFGIAPLQQYLVALPGGRLQALGIAWDSRSEAQGGQRWYDLYAGSTIRPGDRLHWSGIDQNWNYMCADCHSTDVHKNFDPATGTFATTWSEISVGCEGCHGPASAHLEWAETGRADASRGLTVVLDEHRTAAWQMNPSTGNAARLRPSSSRRELDVCARCHSLREQLAEGFRPGDAFLDFYRPTLLERGSYHVDGQQLGEVYDWGSFQQSRMFERGVTCSDCHEPHSARLRAEGNAVCHQCHLATRYDTPAHHFHEAGTDGARCVSCHMPTATYMGVDRRHDHSLRIPRPDLSVTLGTPNACNACHDDKSAQWAASTIARWHGHAPHGFQTFAGTLDAARRGAANAAEALTKLAFDPRQPSLVRATGLLELRRLGVPAAPRAIAAAARDREPLVRLQAAAGLDLLPPEQRLAIGAPLLEDAVRAVRTEAARALVPLTTQMPESKRPAALARALNELQDTLRLTADRPESRVMAAELQIGLGDFAAAEKEFDAALRIDPSYPPIYANLADLWRLRGRDDEAERMLRKGLAAAGDNALLHHSLGLTLVRERRLPEALASFRRAAKLAPDDVELAYALALALAESGQPAQADRELDRALARQPESRDLLWAAATLRRDRGDTAGAQLYARRLAALFPQDPQVALLLEELSTPRN